MSLKFILCRFWLLNLLLVTKIFECVSEEPEESESQEFIICRQCGDDVADPHYIVNHVTPYAIATENETLFERTDVKIQTLVNPFSVVYRIINTSKALCAAVDKWSGAKSWYPGYVYRACVCQQCGSHIGWLFEPVESAHSSIEKATSKGFYGLIYDHILSEKSGRDCTNLVLQRKFHSVKYQFFTPFPSHLISKSFRCTSITTVPNRPFKMSQEEVKTEEKKIVTELTEEQIKFLEQCEARYSNRFTIDDEEFMKLYNKDIPTPPIIPNWFSSRERRGGRQRDNSRPYNYQDNRNSYRNRDNYQPNHQNRGTVRYHDRENSEDYYGQSSRTKYH